MMVQVEGEVKGAERAKVNSARRSEANGPRWVVCLLPPAACTPHSLFRLSAHPTKNNSERRTLTFKIGCCPCVMPPGI